MKQVKISDAKNNLSRHLDYVRRGGRIRILDRDTPVADLVPVQASPEDDDETQLLASLERRGLLCRGEGGPLPRDLFRAGPGGPQSGVLASLLAERRSTR
jgi:antitoxin (DNA-binding transcriptional repressor) of toxin-antitoxin stability system